MHLTDELVRHLEDQTKSLSKVVKVVVEQREALKSGRLDSLQSTMKKLQNSAFDAETAERGRQQVAVDLSRKLGCESTVSALCEALQEENSRTLRKAADDLSRMVATVKSEMQILSSLVDQNRTMNDMLLSEWRRLGGGMSPEGGFNLKG